MSFKLPDLTARTSIIGRTGSGKTVFGTWMLSHAGYDKQPFVCVDFKRDKLLMQIDRAREIGLNELPKHPGLYMLYPNPQDEERLENWLMKVWERGKIGLFFDEAYMLPKTGSALQAILTQGRSKRIPAIILTQRPAWISRFVFSEANQYAVFHLNDKDDEKTVGRFTPRNEVWAFENRLPEFHCRWYDLNKDYSTILKPVQSEDAILQRFDERLKPIRRFY